MKKLLFMSLIGLGLITACKKSATTSTVNQYGTSVNATEKILALPIFDPVDQEEHVARTRGYEFKSSVNGRITYLGARTQPGIYTVSLWDSSAQSLIKSVNVTVPDSSVFSYVDIDDVSITANKVYVVAINSTPVASLTNNQTIFFTITLPANYLPRTVDNITYVASVEKITSSATSLFPYSYEPEPDVIMGLPSFKFEPVI